MNKQYIDNSLKEETYSRLSKEYLSTKEIHVSVIKDGYVLPYNGWLGEPLTTGTMMGGVITDSKVYVENSGVREDLGCPYDFDEKQVKKSNQRVIYIGMFLPVWGHCITDCLKKLWYLQTEECKQLLKEGVQIVYINTMEKLPPSFIEILQALGIEESLLYEIQSITQFKEIIVPENSLFQTKEELVYYTKEFKDTIERIKNNMEVLSDFHYEKVYFSRYHIRGNRDYGEKRIEDVFRYLGYKIVYPETLTFQEQYSIVSQCRYFASTEGSTSHNSMFCKEGANVTIIRKAAYLNAYQFMINQLNNLDVTYVDSHLSICLDKNKLWYGPFFMYVNNNLLDYAHIPRVFNNFSLSNFKEYAKRGYALYHKDLPSSECYAARLLEEMNMSFFCKNWLKRCVRFIFSHGNLSILVPLYKRMTSRG